MGVASSPRVPSCNRSASASRVSCTSAPLVNGGPCLAVSLALSPTATLPPPFRPSRHYRHSCPRAGTHRPPIHAERSLSRQEPRTIQIHACIVPLPGLIRRLVSVTMRTVDSPDKTGWVMNDTYRKYAELAVWAAIIVAVALLGRWAFSVDTHAQEGGGPSVTVTPTSLLDEAGDGDEDEKREDVLDCSDPGNSGHPQCSNPDPTSTPRPPSTRTPTPIPPPTKSPTPRTGPPIPFVPTEVPCPLVGLAGRAMRQAARGRRPTPPFPLMTLQRLRRNRPLRP